MSGACFAADFFGCGKFTEAQLAALRGDISALVSEAASVWDLKTRKHTKFSGKRLFRGTYEGENTWPGPIPSHRIGTENVPMEWRFLMDTSS